MNTIPELVISLVPFGTAFNLTLQYRKHMGGVTHEGPFIVHLELSQFTALSNDLDLYGKTLTAQLFSDLNARNAFINCCNSSLGKGELLNIRYLLQDPALHRLRWELLHDPVDDKPLAFNTRLLVSRFISAKNYDDIELRPRRQLRALFAVAASKNLADFNLADISEIAEIDRARAMLPNIRLDYLGDDKPCTLRNLTDQLNADEGYDILYLLAHGLLVDKEPKLYLSDINYNVSVENGKELADFLGTLDTRRPRLVVLANCEGAGDGYANPFFALGPLLAQQGVPAVIAMQGRFSVSTLDRFAPAFFRELLRDGLANRAMASARISVRDRHDWWVPVLFTRLDKGQIWDEPELITQVPVGLTSPYRALNAYTVDEKHLFFGRDALIKEGKERWLASNRQFLAVTGASGSGKSSLAQAGLLPCFQRDFAEIGFLSTTIIFRPGEQPLNALQDALRRQGVQIAANFIEDLKIEPDLLLKTLEQICNRTDGNSAVLMLIDQFEELFTLCKNDDTRRVFDTALFYAISKGNGRVSVVITLRSDFYSATALLELRELIATYQAHVRNLNTSEMQQSITNPVATVAGHNRPQFETGLVELMIRETGVSPGALPLLSVVLSRLWESGNLNFETYQQLGGVSGALEQQAEQIYEELTIDERRAMRYILLQLVQLGEGNENTRRRVALAELIPAQRESEQIHALVQRLVTARLVSVSTNVNNNNESVVEVSHEALIREWQQLRRWLEEDRELIHLHRQIADAALQWHESDLDPSYLWNSTRLDVAERRGTALLERFTDREQAFFKASKTEAKRQTSRHRRRQYIAVVAIIAVLAMGVLMTRISRQSQALEEKNVASEQQQLETLSRRLATESYVIRNEQYNFAMTLAIQAFRVAENINNDAAIRTLFDSFTYDMDSVFFHDGAVTGAQWNSDESRILTWAREDGVAKLWNTDGSLVTILKHGEPLINVGWIANESRILTESLDGAAKLWDADGNLVAVLEHDNVTTWIQWNRVGVYILTLGQDNTAKLWDVNGDLVAILEHDDVVTDAIWNSDGSRILTRSEDGVAKLWNTDGSVVTILKHGEPLIYVGWIANESRILTESLDGAAKLWDADGNLVAVLEHDNVTTRMRWNRDGLYIFTLGRDNTAKLWDVNGDLVVILEHDYAVNDPIWTSDGSRILTWGEDGAVKLWDTGGNLEALQYSNRGGHRGG